MPNPKCCVFTTNLLLQALGNTSSSHITPYVGRRPLVPPCATWLLPQQISQRLNRTLFATTIDCMLLAWMSGRQLREVSPCGARTQPARYETAFRQPRSRAERPCSKIRRYNPSPREGRKRNHMTHLYLHQKSVQTCCCCKNPIRRQANKHPPRAPKTANMHERLAMENNTASFHKGKHQPRCPYEVWDLPQHTPWGNKHDLHNGRRAKEANDGHFAPPPPSHQNLPSSFHVKYKATDVPSE